MSQPKPIETRSYGDDASQFVDFYSAGSPRGTVVAIHGGYWRDAYGLDLLDPLATHLATTGWNVANIEYRRVHPERSGAWKKMSGDVAKAIDLTQERGGPLIAIGHSAGGQLALWAAAQSNSHLDAVVALAPVSDLFLADGLQLSNHATRALFDTTAAEDPNLYSSASPLHLLPLGIPQLIVHGRKDEDVPFEMAIEYAETAAMVGDDVELLDPKDVDLSLIHI